MIKKYLPSFPLRAAVSLVVITALALLGGELRHARAAASTFRARATLDLCGDYQFGNVSVELKYRVGADPTYVPLTIESQVINGANNTGTFEFSLPATLGLQTISVAAFCRNNLGLGVGSNEKALTNCDSMALHDSDFDGITDNLEDTNCEGAFSPGDASNLFNQDTDGDGVRDLVERVSGTDPANPGSSPRPFVAASAPYDPDGDGASNAMAWRGASGFWFVKDFPSPGASVGFQFGAAGDIPFAYDPANAESNVGVIRRVGNEYRWLFRGPGFQRSDGSAVTDLRFGLFGDNIVLGPWEQPGVTSPAVARLYAGIWSFDIYLRDGTIRHVNWGGNGDIPKVQDYDGDGLFDVAVFRPVGHKTFVIQSSNGLVKTYDFGTATADFTVRGDYTGDGIDDIAFWEPLTALFTLLKSDNGFNETLGNQKNPLYYAESQLGLYSVHLPLNWNRRGGRLLFTVLDHSNGKRFFRSGNDSAQPVQVESWGTAGDSLG